MKLQQIDLSDLRIDPDNLRADYTGINELAESIRRYGLLQNLVVREVHGLNVPGEPRLVDCFVVVAGNRRLKAIQLLASENSWEGPVTCLVVDSDGTFEAITENICRQSVPPWHLGHRYLELCETGLTQKQIAVRLSKDAGHVSLCIQISRGLAPRVVAMLDRVPKLLNVSQVLRIAKLYDPETGEPDETAQSEEFQRQLGQRRQRVYRPRPKIPLPELLVIRFKKLKAAKSVPRHALPYVDAVVRYLDGTDSRLKFP